MPRAALGLGAEPGSGGGPARRARRRLERRRLPLRAGRLQSAGAAGLLRVFWKASECVWEGCWECFMLVVALYPGVSGKATAGVAERFGFRIVLQGLQAWAGV